jgi:hypothetical protein
MKVFLAIIILFSLSITNVLLVNANMLCKVFYHHISDAHETAQPLSHIELGSLVLYFDQKPIINILPSMMHTQDVHAHTKKVFFLPKTSIQSGNCENMINLVHKALGPAYHVQFSQEDKPVPGVKIVITYNEKIVGLSYDQFESIGLQKGLVFRFYNKKLLKQLNTHNSALLQTAYLKKKDQQLLLTVGMGDMMRVL